MRTLLQAITIACALIPSLGYGDVAMRPWGQQLRVDITGQITPGDASKLNSFLGDFKSPERILMLVVHLNSNGGDVLEAIRIGKRIRDARAIVRVTEDSACVSSCVLILAGGLQRAVYGKVGIHRPYLVIDKATTEAEQKLNYKNIEKLVKEYLQAMNVNITLYDAMFRVPPEKVRFLSAQELQDFGLNEADPYWQEAEDAFIAEKQGITKTQWLTIKSTCLKNGPNPGFDSCRERVLKNTK